MMKTLLIIIPTILLASFIAGTQYFAHQVRMTADRDVFHRLGNKHDHGIVVATGHDGRVSAGVDLLIKGNASRLLISGVGDGVRKSDIKSIVEAEITVDETRLDDVLNCCIDLGPRATDTEGNALEAYDWAKTHNINHMIIVTSEFHMPRAMLAFEQHFPEDALVAYTVQTPWLLLDENGFSGWWKSPQRISLMAGETIKYVARLVFS